VQVGRNLPSFSETCWIHLTIDREEERNGPFRNVDKFIPVYTVSYPRRLLKRVAARDAELSPCILECVDGGTGVNTVNTTCVFVSNDKTPPIAHLLTDIKPVRSWGRGKKIPSGRMTKISRSRNKFLRLKADKTRCAPPPASGRLNYPLQRDPTWIPQPIIMLSRRNTQHSHSRSNTSYTGQGP
jgi:hypothetical protein